MTETENDNGMKPLRLGIAGLSHDHVFWILRDLDRPDVDVVGIYEPNTELAQRYAEAFGFDMSIVFSELGPMLGKTKPEAVAAFGSIFEHLAVVETCAPQGIHVMVEKPLAVNWEHAQVMAVLAEQHGIHLMTNYETTWYASIYAAYRLVHEDKRIGEIRKVVVHDGHKGPKEIGVTDEFFDWLTDPVLNGGGALIDFGCYGANLITWLMGGAAPLSITAVIQTNKPHIYPHVDDEATYILTYPQTQGIVQGSWNWPIGRKDMEIYGQTGYVYAPDRSSLRLRKGEREPEQSISVKPLQPPANDPFAYLTAVVRGDIKMHDTDLSSLANNLIVVRILDAARQSAQTGKTVFVSGNP